MVLLTAHEELLLHPVLFSVLLHHHVSVLVLLVHLGMRHSVAHTVGIPVLGGGLHVVLLGAGCHRKHQRAVSLVDVSVNVDAGFSRVHFHAHFVAGLFEDGAVLGLLIIGGVIQCPSSHVGRTLLVAGVL